MKRILLGAVLLLAACGTTSKDESTKFRAWCNTESKDVGPWRTTREAAHKDRDEHLKMWGWHAVRIDAGD